MQTRNPPKIQTFSSELRAEHPEEASGFDSFETDALPWEARFEKARATAKREQRVLLQTGKRTAGRQISHLLAANAIRIVDLADSLILLINRRQTHAAFAVARCIIETSAIPAYVHQEVVPRMKKGRGDQVDSSLRRLLLGVDLGAGIGRKDTIPVPVSSLIKSLCRCADGLPDTVEGHAKTPPKGQTLRKAYSLVSDHTHPNHHATHLSATIDQDGMDWARGQKWDKADLHLLIGGSSFSMWAGGTAFDRSLAEAVRSKLVL